MKSISVIVSLLFLFLFSCQTKTKKESEVEIDKSINSANAFNNLFLDSNKINDFVSKNPDYSSYKQQFEDFYKQRNYEYAWFDTSGLAEQATNFVNLLGTTIADLNDSSLYSKKMMSLYNSFFTDSTAHREKSPLQTELFLTGQFFKYASRVYKGSDVNVEELGWFIPRKKVNLTAILDSVIANKGKDEDKYLPLNKQYKQLQAALTQYYNIQKNNRWDSIAFPAKVYKKGDASAAVLQIKQRLHLLGDLPQEDTTNVYDSATVAAVKLFQQRMGLQTNGVANVSFMKELNDPISERIKKILINLERDRWMAAESDSNYIMVNIPEYKLYVYDNGELQFDMNTIVGKEGTGTVIFTGNLKYIVFSPYWNVPASIVKKEIAPGIARNKNYIASHNMEITGYSAGLPIVRQKPGGNNSLGRVKFLFPNNYDIYLHDTPNHNLFSATNRSFSHGCIRIQNPKKMALYLLRNDTTWTAQKVDSCMNLDHEKWVTLKKPVRVVIGYFTAWVDRDNKLNFRHDIYKHDEEMADKLFVKK